MRAGRIDAYTSEMRVTLASLFLALPLVACATGGASTPAESSVEYVLLDAGRGAPRTTPPELTATRTARAAEASVRVEPIRRGSRPPTDGFASPVAPRPERDAEDIASPVERPRAPRSIVQPIPGGPEDVVLPYPVTRVFRGFGACRGARHHHEAIDIGGVGPDAGLGTPIVAMARARVTMIGRPQDDPVEFGELDTRRGEVERGGRLLPRSKVVEGYGRVHFFTLNKGRWRSGVVVVLEGVGGTLDKHEMRYMHLAEVHPRLAVGDVVQPGQEIGLMGGTAVQQASPHLHLDIEGPDGRRLDVAPLLGLEPTARVCPEPGSRAAAAVAAAGNADGPDPYEEPSAEDEAAAPRVWTRSVKRPKCGAWEGEEDFASGRYYAHDVEVRVSKGERVEVALRRNGGAWKPKLEVLDAEGVSLYQGDKATKAARKGPLKLAKKANGKRGAKAALTMTAREDAVVKVRVTGWSSGRDTVQLPHDGAYGLTISGPACKD